MKIRREEESILLELQSYHVLVGSFIYLTITRLNIVFLVGVISRYMQSP